MSLNIIEHMSRVATTYKLFHYLLIIAHRVASSFPLIYNESESEGHLVTSDSLQPQRLYSPRNSLGQNTGVYLSLSLLQGIFLTQRSNPGLPHCRWILYQLSHKGSPRILEWVAYPFFGRSSQPRNSTRVSCTAGGFFTNWAMRESPLYTMLLSRFSHIVW